MKILVKGEAHKHDVFKLTCTFCGTKVRILRGDPRSKVEWNGSKGGYRVLWICPVCHSREDQYASGNAYEKDALITLEDKKEIDGFKEDHLDDLTEDDISHVYAWDQYRKYHQDVF